MKIDFQKVGVIASYFADNIPNLYVTKLFKLFYYLDFISFNQRKSSVTNDVYYKLPYGPVPSLIKSEIDNLLAGNVIGKEYKSQLVGNIKLEEDKNKNGRVVVSVSKKNDLKLLSKYEQVLLDAIIKQFKNTTATKISDMTHGEKPYKLSNSNSEIDYNLAQYLDVGKILPGFEV